MNARAPVRAMLYMSVAAAMLAPAMTPAMAQDFELDPVYLGESKREVETGTAIATTTIDDDEAQDRQASTIADLVETIPGVSLVNGSSPTGSGLNIRGMGATPTYGTDQKVGISIDGASVGSEELYRLSTQLYTDPALYKEVEVIRGLAGTFEYGSGLVGGLIQLRTRDASDFTGGEPGVKLRQTLQYGSNGNELISSSILAWQPSANLEFMGNYTYREMGVQQDGAGNDIGSEGYALPSYALAARYTFGQSDEHALRLSYTDTSTAERDVPYDTFGTSDGMFGQVDRDIHSATASLAYTYDSPTTDLVNLEAVLSYADQQIWSEGVSGQVGPFAALADADHRYETTKLTVKNTAEFTTGVFEHELRTGVEFTHKERLDASSAPGGIDNRVALFAVDDMTWGGLTLTPALRYEAQRVGGQSYGYYSNQALMGGVSARYEWSSGLSVFASAAYTENLPILDDLTNPAYMAQSEKARTIELGAAYDQTSVFASGDTLSLKANGYVTELYDITSYSGLDRAEFNGVELEASYSLASGLYMDANAAVGTGYGWDAAGAGERWATWPADELRLTLGKRWGERLDLSWETVLRGAVDTGAATSDAYAVHNARLTYRPQDGWAEGTELRVGLLNVFNRDYQPFLATRKAPGTSVKFTVARTF